jgi:hypothetical protein
MIRIVIMALACLLFANAKSQNEKVTVKMCGMENRPPSLIKQRPQPLQRAARLIDNNGVVTVPVVVMFRMQPSFRR